MASEGYQMTGALSDAHGGIVEIGYNGSAVEIRPHGLKLIVLDETARHEWDQLYIAASHEAEAHP